MNELFPFIGGLLAGIVMRGLPSRKGRLVWLIVQGSVIGGVATFASGEYRFGWYFVLVDIALSIGAGLGASVCAAIWNVPLCFSRGRNCSRKILSALASAD